MRDPLGARQIPPFIKLVWERFHHKKRARRRAHQEIVMTPRIHAAARERRCCATPIAIAVSAALLSIASAHAQTAPAAGVSAGASADTPAETPAADATQAAKVVVNGYRYSIEKSLDQKRDANSIVEVVTAEDIGKFPDK